jgi:hypothetical protein
VNGDQSNTSVTNAGAAYVFVRNGNVWSQQAYVKASNTRADSSFGLNVSASGDTIAVGAPQESSNATSINGNQSDTTAPGAGAIYVFARSGAVWSQQAYVKPSNTRGGMGFGFRLSLAGDALAGGAVHELSGSTGINGNQNDLSKPGSGAAYFFVRTGTTWTQRAYLKASNTSQQSLFGYSVGVAKDLLAIGAINEPSAAVGIGGNEMDMSASASGAVYAF